MYRTQLQIPNDTTRINNAVLATYSNGTTALFGAIQSNVGDLIIDISRSPIRERNSHTPVPCPVCGDESTTLYTCVQYPITENAHAHTKTEPNVDVSLHEYVQYISSLEDKDPSVKYLFCDTCWETIKTETDVILEENKTEVIATNI